MALAHGVTTYRVVGARLPWGASQRERVKSGEVLAPRLWVGGLRLDQQGEPSLAVRRVADAASARREVDEQASLGADWVSIAGTTTLDVGRAIVRAARAQKKRVSVESGTMSASGLIRLGVDAIDRVGFVGRSRDDVEREASGRRTTARRPRRGRRLPVAVRRRPTRGRSSRRRSSSGSRSFPCWRRSTARSSPRR